MKYEFRRYKKLQRFISVEEAKAKLAYEISQAFSGVVEIPIQKAIVEADSPEEAQKKVEKADWVDDIMVMRTY